MADDTQFDPFAGIITPQALQLQRMAQMQQAMQQAGASTSGQAYGQRTSGLVAGQQIAQAAQGGGPPNSPLDQLARGNQQILSANPNITQGADQFEARAQDAEQKAQAFYSAGNYPAAGQFMNAAAYYRKQGVDQSKTLAEAFMDRAKGNDATANMNDIKPVVDPNTGLPGYASVPKAGGAATPITGAQALPPTPVATVDLRGSLPGFERTLDLMKQYKTSADQAVIGLGRANDMEQQLNSGKIIAGTGADARLGFNNFLVSAGLAAKGGDVTANTVNYINDAKQQALSLRPPSMQRLTNADLTFLNGLSGGDIEWNANTLKRVVQIQKRTFQASIDTYTNQRNSALAATYEKGLDPNVASSMRAGIKSMGDPGAPAAPATAPAAPAAPGAPGIVTDSQGVQWKYKGTGDPKSQSNYVKVSQ